MNILIIKERLDKNATFWFLSKIDRGLTHSGIWYLSANAVRISNSGSGLTKENG